MKQPPKISLYIASLLVFVLVGLTLFLKYFYHITLTTSPNCVSGFLNLYHNSSHLFGERNLQPPWHPSLYELPTLANSALNFCSSPCWCASLSFSACARDLASASAAALVCNATKIHIEELLLCLGITFVDYFHKVYEQKIKQWIQKWLTHVPFYWRHMVGW